MIHVKVKDYWPILTPIINYKKVMVSYFVFFWLTPKCENASIKMIL